MLFSRSLVRTGVLVGLFSLVVAGCGESTTPKNDTTASNVSLPIAARLKSLPSCDTDLLARVVVDGNRTIELSVDCGGGTVSGTISGLAPGSHTFELRFTLLVDVGGTLREILVATAVTTGGISSGEDTPITFPPGALVFPDDDRDGWTNLAEFIVGTDYLLASSAPESSSRRKSTNYSVADSTGATPAVGVASGGPYAASSAGSAPAIGTASGGRYTDTSGRVPSNR